MFPLTVHLILRLPLTVQRFVTCLLSLGINRLLSNGTYEAAFPPHEVVKVAVL